MQAIKKRETLVDEKALYQNEQHWIEKYHKDITSGAVKAEYGNAPSFLRRLTVEECTIIQTFPATFKFYGSQSSQCRQIGNAVPCNLAYSVAQMVSDCINEEINSKIISMPFQLKLAC